MDEQNDNAVTGNENSAPQNNTPQTPWFIDDGVPGVGERPQWLPQKYKTVKAAVESGLELEKRLGAPPVNDYDFGEHGDAFDKDHDALKELTTYAKEKRVPQEVFSKMLESMSKYGSSFVPNPEVEMAKLGENGKQRVEVLNNFVKANFSEKAAQALFAGMSTAESVIAMEEVKNKMIGNNQIPTGSDSVAGSPETIEQLQKELAAPGNFQKFKTDENYANDWRRRVAIASKNSSEWVDKQGY